MDTLFNTVAWAKGSSIYEINLRQYTEEGSFNAFKNHLPRLKDMGITILWFMPITPISHKERLGSLGSYYACSSYTQTNPEYGSLDEFKTLVAEAQGLGFKVIIDWVANHTGWDHEWTIPHPEWYKKDAAGNFTESNGWKDVIDLNYASSEMRQAMIEAMQFWIKECNIDGFRCDMAHLVPLDFWKAARQACDALKPLFWLAECEVTAYHDVFDATYAWHWMHETELFIKQQKSLNDIYNVLHSYTQYPAGALKLFFTANHDENSWNGTEYEKYGKAALPLAVFTSTWKGIPLMYSGQESPNYKRLAFFDKDPIAWNTPPLLHDFYKTLLSIRNNEAISVGETFVLPNGGYNVMAYLRKFDNQVVLVILNLSGTDRILFNVAHPWIEGNFKQLFSGITYTFKPTETFELSGFDYLVFVKQ